MFNETKCPAGHSFDSSKWTSCPECARTDVRRIPKDRSRVLNSDYFAVREAYLDTDIAAGVDYGMQAVGIAYVENLPGIQFQRYFNPSLINPALGGGAVSEQQQKNMGFFEKIGRAVFAGGGGGKKTPVSSRRVGVLSASRSVSNLQKDFYIDGLRFSNGGLLDGIGLALSVQLHDLQFFVEQARFEDEKFSYNELRDFLLNNFKTSIRKRLSQYTALQLLEQEQRDKLSTELSRDINPVCEGLGFFLISFQVLYLLGDAISRTEQKNSQNTEQELTVKIATDELKMADKLHGVDVSKRQQGRSHNGDFANEDARDREQELGNKRVYNDQDTAFKEEDYRKDYTDSCLNDDWGQKKEALRLEQEQRERENWRNKTNDKGEDEVFVSRVSAQTDIQKMGINEQLQTVGIDVENRLNVHKNLSGIKTDSVINDARHGVALSRFDQQQEMRDKVRHSEKGDQAHAQDMALGDRKFDNLMTFDAQKTELGIDAMVRDYRNETQALLERLRLELGAEKFSHEQKEKYANWEFEMKKNLDNLDLSNKNQQMKKDWTEFDARMAATSRKLELELEQNRQQGTHQRDMEKTKLQLDGEKDKREIELKLEQQKLDQELKIELHKFSSELQNKMHEIQSQLESYRVRAEMLEKMEQQGRTHTERNADLQTMSLVAQAQLQAMQQRLAQMEEENRRLAEQLGSTFRHGQQQAENIASRGIDVAANMAAGFGAGMSRGTQQPGTGAADYNSRNSAQPSCPFNSNRVWECGCGQLNPPGYSHCMRCNKRGEA